MFVEIGLRIDIANDTRVAGFDDRGPIAVEQ
jgi:hypothetical protein